MRQRKASKAVVSIADGVGFADADAAIRARREELHKLLDEALDNGNSTLLSAVSGQLKAYGAMIAQGINTRSGSR